MAMVIMKTWHLPRVGAMAGLRNLGCRVRRGRGQVRWLEFVAGRAGGDLSRLPDGGLGVHEALAREGKESSPRVSGGWGVRSVLGGMRGSQ